MKKSICKFLALTTVVSAGIITKSHQDKLQQIKNEIEKIPPTLKTSSIDEDIESIKCAVCKKIKTYGGLEFVWGDFEVRNGEARCGGIAKQACFEGAKNGFESDIKLEFSGFFKLHYYAVLSRDGHRYRFDGKAEDFYFEKLPDSRAKKEEGVMLVNK
jgi:hypothetical protein